MPTDNFQELSFASHCIYSCQVVLDKGISAWNFKYLKPKSSLIAEIET